jgi:hypothetical protein
MNERSLLPDSISLPVLSGEKITAKIIPDQTLPSKGFLQISEEIKLFILRAAETSKEVREYISYVIHHDLFKISIKKLSDSERPNAMLYISEHNPFLMNFNIEDDYSLSVKRVNTILHEFWHSFWILLRANPSNKNVVLCSSEIGISNVYPFNASLYEIENNQNLVNAAYVNLKLTVRELEAHVKRYALSPNNFKYLNEKLIFLIKKVENNHGYMPNAFPFACSEEARNTIKQAGGEIQQTAENGIIVRFTNKISYHEKGIAYCNSYTTCDDHNNALCQALASVADPIINCNHYENLYNFFLDQPFVKQLSEEGRKLFQLLKNYHFNLNFTKDQDAQVMKFIYDYAMKKNLSLIQKLKLENAVDELLEKFVLQKTVISECDAILKESYCSIKALSSSDSLIKKYYQQIDHWIFICHNGTLPYLPNTIDTAPVTAVVPNGILQYVKSGGLSFLGSMLLTFILTSLIYALKLRTTNPRTAEKIIKNAGKILNLAACIRRFSFYPGLAVFALSEFFLHLNTHYKLLSATNAETVIQSVSLIGLFGSFKRPMQCMVSFGSACLGSAASHFISRKIFSLPKKEEEAEQKKQLPQMRRKR